MQQAGSHIDRSSSSHALNCTGKAKATANHLTPPSFTHFSILAHSLFFTSNVLVCFQCNIKRIRPVANVLMGIWCNLFLAILIYAMDLHKTNQERIYMREDFRNILLTSTHKSIKCFVSRCYRIKVILRFIGKHHQKMMIKFAYGFLWKPVCLRLNLFRNSLNRILFL